MLTFFMIFNFLYVPVSIYLSIIINVITLHTFKSNFFINFFMYWLAKLFKSNSTSPLIQKYITKCNRRIQLIMWHAVKYGALFSETALVVLLKCVLGGEL